VRVEIERDRDARVPEHLGDDLRVDAAAGRNRRRGVSQIVEADPRQAGAFPHGPRREAKRRPSDRLANDVREDESWSAHDVPAAKRFVA